MSPEVLSGLILFALVSSLTPGPNNLMLMASGANFGFWPTLPHMLGIGFGFTLMIVLVGLGVAEVFQIWPELNLALKIFGVAYMIYLAWKIANAAEPGKAKATAKPMSFLQAAAFQWVNPKAWAMSLTATTVYATAGDATGVYWVAGVFGAINFPCISLWTLLGIQVRRWLKNPTRLRIFNWSMAGLLILSLYPVFLT